MTCSVFIAYFTKRLGWFSRHLQVFEMSIIIFIILNRKRENHYVLRRPFAHWFLKGRIITIVKEYIYFDPVSKWWLWMDSIRSRAHYGYVRRYLQANLRGTVLTIVKHFLSIMIRKQASMTYQVFFVFLNCSRYYRMQSIYDYSKETVSNESSS